MFRTFLKKRSRRGFTMTEIIVATGLFAIILAIIISMFLTSLTTIQIENDAAKFQQDIDDFLYNLTIEMKSATSVVVSGTNDMPILEIAGSDSLVFYEINNRRGEIYRSADGYRIPLADDFFFCRFYQEDATSVTIMLALTDDDYIEYVLRCGSTYYGEPEEEGFLAP